LLEKPIEVRHRAIATFGRQIHTNVIVSASTVTHPDHS
jgi:hypothetical protein